MDKLDLDLLSKILNQLPLTDKLRLRKVSKKFLEVIDNQNPKSLVIIRKNKFWIRSTWFHDFKLIDYSNLIILNQNNLALFRSNFFGNRFFVNLNKLHLDYANCDKNKDKQIQIDLNFLSYFQRLEILNINFSTHQLGSTNRLILKGLKYLRINLNQSDYDLIFDAPVLEFLSVNCLKNLKFINLKTIKHLKLDLNFDLNYEQVKEFKNLLYLDYDSFKIEDYEALKNYVEFKSNLKQLCITCYQTVNLDELKICSEINGVKVYVNGLLINHWYKFSSVEQKVLERYNLNIYLENYSSIHNLLVSIVDINYSAWETEWLNHRIPDDFLGKLVNLSSICTNRRVLKVDYFIQFLLNCEMIHTLRLVDSSLDQQFYSKLTFYLPFIRFLTIQDEQNLIKQLDLNFLYKLKYLERLIINYQMSFELIRGLFLSLNNLKEIEILYNEQFLLISRCAYVKNSNRFKLTDNLNLKRFAIDLTNEYKKDDVCFAIGHFLEK